MSSQDETLTMDAVSRQQARHLESEQQNDGSEETHSSWTTSEEEFSSFFTIFLSLLALVLVFSKFLHDRPNLESLLPEAGMTMIVGIVASAFIWLAAPFLYTEHETVNIDVSETEEDQLAEVAEGLLSFSSTFFFEVLLPPIIFNSGYHVNRKLFMQHIGPIILYAIVGTFINIFAMTAMLHFLVSANLTGSFRPHITELLTFGSFIASTDPVATLAVFQKKRVDPQLFYLVFGESVLNDGVCLVLFAAFSNIVGETNSGGKLDAALGIMADFLISFCGSLVLGVASGLCAALLLKVVDMRGTPLLELSLFVLVMYFPFFASEAVGLSGIVTILFTGISAKHYAEPNLSIQTQNDADVLFRVTAHLSETAIFLELGLSVFGLGLSNFIDFYVRFILWSLVACLIGRACGIYLVTFFINQTSAWMSRCKSRFEKRKEGGTPDVEGSTTDYHSINCERPEPVIMSNKAHMLWFSGLRGAVAYACAKNFPNVYGNRGAFVNITMFVILVTVLFVGGTTEFFLHWLRIDTNVDEKKYLENSKGDGTVLTRIDQEYLSPCVKRDVDGEHPPPPRSQGFRRQTSDLSEATRALSEAASQEMTIDDHETTLRRMGLDGRPQTATYNRKSLYDYGAR